MKPIRLPIYKDLITEDKVHETVWNRIGSDVKTPVDNRINRLCYPIIMNVRHKTRGYI